MSELNVDVRVSKPTSGFSITNIGVSIILIYSIVKLMEIYGIGLTTYGSYLAFYTFLFISSFVLPLQYPSIE